MRGCLLLVAAAACAQDNRGFVNQRLLTQNFVKNSLKAPPKAPAAEASSQCAIPLLRAAPAKAADPKMVISPPKNTGDEKMIWPTIPVCPAR